ncbi:MAG TPA: hypothetical protein VKX28_23990 [Xanthobacteraceae bacterium]|nr:hypothetical protein [Xanthobacteraceae bacterium]
MPDEDPNKRFGDARATLRETSKWIVTILGATVVLVIGGGLVAKIADLDTTQRFIAAAALVALTLFCLWPLRDALKVIANKLASFDEMVRLPDYEQARADVDHWIAGQYPAAIGTMGRLHHRYVELTRIVNDPAIPELLRNDAESELDELQPRIKEVMELANTQFLRLRFEKLEKTTIWVLPGIGFALFIFLVSTHKEDATEKLLRKPIVMSIPWSTDVEGVLKAAGMSEKCYAKVRPRLLQISEMSGLRAGVIVIPRDLGAGCNAVRVIVGNDHEVSAAE